MSNFSTLKSLIISNVYLNGNNEITGQKLQDVLISMVDTIGEGYAFMGVANGGTSPVEGDANVWYIGAEGTYNNFGTEFVVPSGSFGIFTYDGSWTRTLIKAVDIIDSLVSDETSKALAASRGKELHQETLYNNRNKVQRSWTDYKGLVISDEDGNDVCRISEEGEIKTADFNSSKALEESFSLADLEFSDKDGNVVLRVNDGNIYTQNFDSSLIPNAVPAGTLKLPTLPVPIYITTNDIDTSNGWGIGSRNYALSVWLDHFFNTDHEIAMQFADGSTFKAVPQKIVGNGDDAGWNGNVNKLETTENWAAGADTMQMKIRSVLNTSTSAVKPIVLQIGDSVTEGWFGGFPAISGTPLQSWAWTSWFFGKDKAQAGSGYDCLFVGSLNKSTYNYDGVSGTGYAYGVGGKTARWYVTGADCPFSNNGAFSLAYYLSQYKTLADDGVTRLVVGSTAGTAVTDATAWDLCTPNVVVVQLGLNDVLADWKTYMPQIVSSIKTEYPTMKVIISVMDACDCMFPSRYPNYSGVFLDGYNGMHAKMLDAYTYAIDNWQDEVNGVYVLYSGAVMPMPESCNVRKLDGGLTESEARYVGVDSVERVPHPSKYGHRAIGYQLYSAIKWILS